MADRWQRHGGTYTGFLQYVDMALKRLVTADRQAIAEGLPAPYIGREVQCVLCYAGVVASTGQEEAARASALSEVAPLLPEAVYQAALDLAEDEHRASTLIAVASHLPEAERRAAMRLARQSSLAVALAARQAWLLNKAGPLLPKTAAGAANRRGRGEWVERVTLVRDLVPTLVTLPANALYDCWAAVLPLLKEQPASAVLSNVPPLVPVIAALGGEAALSQTLWAVEEVDGLRQAGPGW